MKDTDYELPALGMRGFLGQKKRSMVSSLLFSSRPGGYHEEGEPAMLAFPEQGSEDPVCLASGGLAALVRCPLALGGPEAEVMAMELKKIISWLPASSGVFALTRPALWPNTAMWTTIPKWMGPALHFAPASWAA